MCNLLIVEETCRLFWFAAIDQMKDEALAKGLMSSSEHRRSDVPTPKHIVEAMQAAVTKAEHHQYPHTRACFHSALPLPNGIKPASIVTVDRRPKFFRLSAPRKVSAISRSRSSIREMLFWAFAGITVYPVGTLLPAASRISCRCSKKNNYLPDFTIIPEDVLKRAKLMFLNYPNNPTSAGAPRSFYEEAIALAKKYNIIICHDAAYSEVYFDGEKPMSFLEIDGAKEVGIEFHSLSKTYNMTGWRIGFAVGNAKVIAGLGKIKSNLDSGVFQAVQEASIVALQTDDAVLADLRKIFQERAMSCMKGSPVSA